MKFTEILEQLNIEYITGDHRHCRPGWIAMDCPWCGKDSHKWHLGYSLEDHYLSCWRCGYHSAIDTLQEYTELSFYKCKKLLANIEKIQLPKQEKIQGKLILPKGIKPLQTIHKRYLRNRGFKPSSLERLWDIQGIGMASHLSWRIFIPIIYHGKTVSWTTRSISNGKKIVRYINAGPTEEAYPIKTLLYGQDFARDTIIICEGPIDVWKIGPGAVATMGVNYSNEQLLKMTEYQTRVICFDNEKPAQARARQLCDELSVFPGKTFNIQLDSKDAAEASKREINLIRKEFLR